MAKKIFPQSQYSPLFASVSWDFNNEDDKARQEWFWQFSTFPVWIKLGMVDLEVEGEIRRASIRIFGDEDPQRAGEISRIIRDIFRGKILKDEILERLIRKTNLSKKEAQKAEEEILRIIELIRKIGKEKELKIFDKMPIIMALKKYEDLGKQLVSSEPLNLKDYSYPVFPSVKNWLEDYIQKTGAHSHSAIERSDYLFNSENGKKLDNYDRQKVSLILESYDKDKDLLIDKDEQRIIFDFSLEDPLADRKDQNYDFDQFEKTELKLKDNSNNTKEDDNKDVDIERLERKKSSEKNFEISKQLDWEKENFLNSKSKPENYFFSNLVSRPAFYKEKREIFQKNDSEGELKNQKNSSEDNKDFLQEDNQPINLKGIDQQRTLKKTKNVLNLKEIFDKKRKDSFELAQ